MLPCASDENLLAGHHASIALFLVNVPRGLKWTYHILLQGATSKYEKESDAKNGVTVQPASGDLSEAKDGPSATLRFTRSSAAASTVRISCKVRLTALYW
jgi:hypothetical protein